MLYYFNVYNPVGRKRTHTLVVKSRASSSRCCGLSSVVYHREPVAHLLVHRAVTREVVSSKLRPDQHSGSLNN